MSIYIGGFFDVQHARSASGDALSLTTASSRDWGQVSTMAIPSYCERLRQPPSVARLMGESSLADLTRYRSAAQLPGILSESEKFLRHLLQVPKFARVEQVREVAIDRSLEYRLSCSKYL